MSDPTTPTYIFDGNKWVNNNPLDILKRLAAIEARQRESRQHDPDCAYLWDHSDCNCWLSRP